MRPKIPTGSESDPIRIGYPHGAFNRDGRWGKSESGDALVAGINRDLIRRRREGGSPQEFVEWLSKYPLASEATKMLGIEFVQKMADLDHAEDWSTLTMYSITDFSTWLQRCGRPWEGHYWNDAGQWVPKP